MQTKWHEITFTDADVVNPDDFIPAAGENGRAYNPHNVRPWLLHDHGFVLAIVFADCLQDAIDIAVDADKLDRYLIDLTSASVREDYLTPIFEDAAAGFDENCPEWTAPDGTHYWWKTEPAFLGNAGEPFDIEALGAIEMPNPPFSFVALFQANLSDKAVLS